MLLAISLDMYVYAFGHIFIKTSTCMHLAISSLRHLRVCFRQFHWSRTYVDPLVCNPPTTSPSPLHACVSSPCTAGDAAVQRECERVRSKLASNSDGELLGSRSSRVGQRHGQLHGCSIQRSNVGPAQRHVSTRSSKSGRYACVVSAKLAVRSVLLAVCNSLAE